MIKIKGLWVDDERPLPVSYAQDGWIVATSYNDAISKLTEYDFELVSLDHDLASFNEDGREMTGYDVALWIVEQKYQGLKIPDKIWAHSANPVGAQRIEGVIKRYLI